MSSIPARAVTSDCLFTLYRGQSHKTRSSVSSQTQSSQAALSVIAIWKTNDFVKAAASHSRQSRVASRRQRPSPMQRRSEECRRCSRLFWKLRSCVRHKERDVSCHHVRYSRVCIWSWQQYINSSALSSRGHWAALPACSLPMMPQTWKPLKRDGVPFFGQGMN